MASQKGSSQISREAKQWIKTAFKQTEVKIEPTGIKILLKRVETEPFFEIVCWVNRQGIRLGQGHKCIVREFLLITKMTPSIPNKWRIFLPREKCIFSTCSWNYSLFRLWVYRYKATRWYEKGEKRITLALIAVFAVTDISRQTTHS